MDGLGPTPIGNSQQFIDVEVGCRGSAFTERESLVGLANVQAVKVALGVDSDGLDAQAMQAAGDAGGDGAAIGNQDLIEQGTNLCRAVPALCCDSGRPLKGCSCQSAQTSTSTGVGL